MKKALTILNGGTVWVYPHGSPGVAVTATVDLISENQRSIALRLSEKPSWVRIADGVLLHKDYGQIEMLLMREAIGGQPIGPWIEISKHGHYEIETTKPDVHA